MRGAAAVRGRAAAVGGTCSPAGAGGFPGDTVVGLRQRRVRHACRRTPLPPNTGMSTHEMHVPQLTELRQPEHRPHLEVTLPLPPPPLWPKPLP